MSSLFQTSLEAVSCSKVFVRDLCDGQAVESPFVVRDRTRRQKRNGESFLKLQLGDCTGVVEGVVWDEVDQAAEAGRAGLGRDRHRALLRGAALRLVDHGASVRPAEPGRSTWPT